MTRPHTIEEARAAKKRAKLLFRNVSPAPIGIGITRVDGGYGVKVNLQREISSNIALPNDVDGVPVLFEVTGPASRL